MTRMTYAHVTLNCPAGWIDRSTVTLIAPPEDGFSANVVIGRDPFGLDVELDQYVDDQIAVFKKQSSGYKLKSKTPTELSGQAAIRLEHSFLLQSGVPLLQVQVYTVGPDGVITVALTDLAERFEAQRSTFDDVLESIEVR